MPGKCRVEDEPRSKKGDRPNWPNIRVWSHEATPGAQAANCPCLDNAPNVPPACETDPGSPDSTFTVRMLQSGFGNAPILMLGRVRNRVNSKDEAAIDELIPISGGG